MLTRAFLQSVFWAVSLPCLAIGADYPGTGGPGAMGGSAYCGSFLPGGGAGGTIGSLPMVSDGAGLELGPAKVVKVDTTTSGAIIAILPPPGTPLIGYVWIADGVMISSGSVNLNLPSVSFYASDVAQAYLTVTSLRLGFVGPDGQFKGIYEMPKTF